MLRSTSYKGGSILRFVLGFLRIRTDEAPTVTLLVLYFFLAMTSTSIVKSLQNALYLSEVRFDWRLPLLYVGIALLSVPMVFFYQRHARRRSQFLLTSATLVLFIASVLGFLALFKQGRGWAYPAFYLWGGVFTVLLPLQGWMVSYEFYGLQAAKRLFAVLGAGGILGGAFGGYYTALLAERYPAGGLLAHVLVLLVVLQVLVLCSYRFGQRLLEPRLEEEGPAEQRESRPPLKELFRSSYLRHLAALVLVTGLATTLIDLQYKFVLDRRFPGSEAGITQFFGLLLGSMFVFSAVFQLFGTSVILRHFGIRTALLILPLSLCLGSAAVAITAAFWSVVSLKALEGALRTSLDRTSVELLYVPLAHQSAAPVKSLIDVVMFRLGDAAGAAVFISVSLAGEDVIRTSGMVVAVAGLLWVATSRRLGREYLEMLRRSLEVKPRAAVGGQAWQVEGEVPQETLLACLDSSNPHKVRFGLEQLSLLSSRDVRSLDDWSSSGEGMIQTRIGDFYRTELPEWLERVAALCRHSDPEVAAAALQLLVRYRPSQHLEELRRSLGGASPPPSRFLLYLDRYAKGFTLALDPERIERWEHRLTEDQAVVLARLMGRSHNPRYLPLLARWSGTPGERGRTAILALGGYADPRYVDLLVERLRTPWSRKAAREALAHYGDRVVPRLNQILRDPQASLAAKREIPHILRRINSPAARDALFAALYLPDLVLSFRALKALNKIRDLRKLPFTKDSFIPLLQVWLKQYYELTNLDLLLDQEDGAGCRLLRRAVHERIEWKVEKIFRGMGLFFPYEDAYVSYLGYTSDRMRLRENAIELVDAHIRGELRQTLMPIFTEQDRHAIARRGRQLFSLPSRLDTVLGEALVQGDPWLKCCIIAALVELGPHRFRTHLQQATEDIHPLVRESAQWAMSRLPRDPQGDAGAEPLQPRNLGPPAAPRIVKDAGDD